MDFQGQTGFRTQHPIAADSDSIQEIGH
jgi:hypothetical protein